ncbi:zinc-finger domain-containing protein [Halobacillus litoralis]|uniref:Zinc-finger domain-containing protein n=1 Tax=Halobacillus litoralis TaxID=45668 RepID=A0A845E3F6_9BACI|nr:zinc-finger domain-containing protein [Halobacillus litoralis]MYL50274.1 zinc-finger domain-containing protein [Halobacillus litoralis]
MLDQKVLKQINKLEKENCKGCEKIVGLSHKNFASKVCKSCPIGKEIRNLGAKVEITKTQRVLNKGEDMTYEDILFLLRNEVEIQDIFRAVGLTHASFRTYMKRHERDTHGRPLPKKRERVSLERIWSASIVR